MGNNIGNKYTDGFTDGQSMPKKIYLFYSIDKYNISST